MKLNYLLTGLLLFAISAVYAQERNVIKGRVLDDSNRPLEGATVSSTSKTKRSLPTDKDGNFRIEVSDPLKDSIKVQSVGFKTSTVPINGQSNLTIYLTRRSYDLNDVVVVAYGTQKRANLTGAVTTVAPEGLLKSSEPDLNNELTGRAPGVRVLQLSSQPGQYDSQIDIRGFSTVSSSDILGQQVGGPLFVIDGVPRDQSTFQMLDPNEIASLSVLKDATSSIYGVQAANGVILVTTKKGGNHPVRVNYTGQYGIQYVTKYPKLMDAYDYATLYDEMQINNALTHNQQQPAVMFSPQQLADFKSGKTPSTDWLKAVLGRSAGQTQQNLNISGGSDKFQYFVSGGYFNQNGLFTSGIEIGKKYNLRSDIVAELAKGLKLDVNLGLIDNIQNQPSTAAWSLLANTWRFSPAYPVYSNNDPSYFNHVPNYDSPNSVALIDQNKSGYNYTNSRDFMSTFTLEYKIPYVDGLTAKGLFAYDNSYSMNKHFTKAFSEYDYDAATGTQVAVPGFNGPSQLSQLFGEGLKNDLQLSLNYAKTIGKHDFSLVGLYEQVYNQGDATYSAGRYVIDILDQLAATDPSTAVINSSNFTNSNVSYVGKFNYSYAGKYLLEAGFRDEGSSYFPAQSRWGFFPYVSVGWNLAQESFIKNNLTFVDRLKIRGSAGREGDDQGAASSFPAFLTGYTYPGGNSVFGGWGTYSGAMFGNTFIKGVGFKNSVNPNITWYTSEQTDLGLDFSLWNGKLTFSGDVFRRDRSGLLATPIIAVPGTYGINLPPQNINSDRTIGFEVTLGTTGQIGNVHYSVSPNISFTRTKWVHFEQGSPLNSMDNYRGQLSNQWTDIIWGYKVIGQFQNYKQMYAAPSQDGAGNKSLLPGDYQLADLNHDGQIDGNDQTVIASGGAKPLMYFGTDINISWKGFDLSLLLQGATMFHQHYTDQLSTPLFFGNSDPITAFGDRWHQANMFDPNSPWIPGRYPPTGQLQLYFSPNTANVYNATYLRVKSLQIGYNFGKPVLSRLHMKGLRVFASAYNLFTFTGKGLDFIDPEYTSSRLYSYNYPITMNVNFGLQVTF